MSTFELAIPTILKHEGGYVNNPNDPGGATNYGVSLRWLKTLGEEGDFDHDGVIGPHDIACMTKDQACHLYQHYWWDKYNYGAINDQTIATKVFDMAVNMGAAAAHKIVQRALDVPVDGILGEHTLATINMTPAPVLIHTIRDEQAQYYRRIVAANPKLSQFLKGWLIRAAS